MFYGGVISAHAPQPKKAHLYTILYDDGKKETLDLSAKVFRLPTGEDAEPDPVALDVDQPAPEEEDSEENPCEQLWLYFSFPLFPMLTIVICDSPRSVLEVSTRAIGVEAASSQNQLGGATDGVTPGAESGEDEGSVRQRDVGYEVGEHGVFGCRTQCERTR